MGTHHPIRKTVAPEPVAIPDKLYFRIGDVARLCDVQPYVLRFWETEFPQLKPNKGGTGQRLYRKKDVEMALRIKSLLYDQGYTIPGARQVFKSGIEPAAEAAPVGGVADGGLRVVPHAEPATEAYDRGAELRLRAQLADLRDELQALVDQLSKSAGNSAAFTSQEPTARLERGAAESFPPAEPVAATEAAARPRPRLMLEPKAKPKPATQTTLHLTTQADLFPAE